MTDDLAIKLYKSISAANEPRIFERWHASSIADCPRAHFYKRLGIPALSTPTAAKMLRWQAGHIMEAVIRPHLVSLYPDLVSNVRLTSPLLDLTGEYDNYSEANKLLVEIKSVGVRAPRYKKANEQRFHLREDGPYLGHVYQNHAYVLLLRELGLPVEYINYVYITLEGLILTYQTKVDDKVLLNIKKRLQALQMALTGTLPDCLCTAKHPLWGSTMQFCDYRTEKECCSEQLYKQFKEKTSGPARTHQTSKAQPKSADITTA